MRRAVANPLIEAQGIRKIFYKKSNSLFAPREEVRAVNGVSLAIARGKTLGVVGESGCGKTTLGKILVNLIQPTEGRVLFEGTNTTLLTARARKALSSRIQFIFQDPYSSLNPRMTMLESIAEGLGQQGSRREKMNTALAAAERCGLSTDLADSYPHQFSGGQRQRICIARAVVSKPDFIVCDEPVSSLDVSIRSQILNLLKELQDTMALSCLFITHDLRIAEFFCDEIAVMYRGVFLEKGKAESVFRNPQHPYTESLSNAIPRLTWDEPGENRAALPQTHFPEMPIRNGDEIGCPYAPRCPYAEKLCRETTPLLREFTPDRWIACHKPLRN